MSDLLVTLEEGEFPGDGRGKRTKIVKNRGEILISFTDDRIWDNDAIIIQVAYHMKKQLEKWRKHE